MGKGFLSFDFLFSSLILIMMLSTALKISHDNLQAYETAVNEKIFLDKLLSISDYIIRDLAVEYKDGEPIPNKISKDKFEKMDFNLIGEKLDIDSLQIGFKKNDKTCIYRIVLYEGKIKKLYFCADFYEYP